MDAPSPILTIARLARVVEQQCGPDLTLAQYRVLGLVADGDERASRLAQRLAVAKPTVTVTVDGLVERGLVTRRAATHDRRVVEVTITDEGRATLARAERRMADGLGEVLDRCDDRDAAVAALADLGDALNQRAAERMAAPGGRPRA